MDHSLINNVANYIIHELNSLKHSVNPLKLQKLLYYVEAWYLAFYDEELFEGEEFMAWLHGPVNRCIYYRFNDTGMYDPISLDTLPSEYNPEELPKKIRTHVDSVLEEYGIFSATQLESLSHSEDPWIEARRGFETWEKSDIPISKETMRKYYQQRIVE